MEAALIAPVDLVHTQTTSWQLMLPHIVHPEYLQFYREASGRGDCIILDNGAAERVAVSDDDLCRTAMRYHVSELAIPDILGDWEATVQRLEAFFKRTNFHVMQPLINLGMTGHFKFGFVAQGRTVQEAIKCVGAVMSSMWGHYIGVIYLPRLLLDEGGYHARIELARAIHEGFEDRVELHMFGTNPRWPQEVMAVRHEVPFVRSVDTSLPYNYALAGKKLGDARPSERVHRTRNYFDTDWSKVQPGLIHDNIKTFLEWIK